MGSQAGGVYLLRGIPSRPTIPIICIKSDRTSKLWSRKKREKCPYPGNPFFEPFTLDTDQVEGSIDLSAPSFELIRQILE
jgi:hypothetical protein